MSRAYTDNQIKWLKKYVDSETTSVRRAVDKVEVTNSKAVDKVEANNNGKFEAQNEWRAQFKEQASNFVTRRELWGAVVTIITLLISIIKMKVL